MSSVKQRRSRGSIISMAIVAICALAALLLYINKQFILDYSNFWQFQPSSEIATLAKRINFSDKGTFYFYASHPSIDNAEAFNKECGREEASTAILGCYDGRSIFIYNVTDPKLDGIREVTAAHEMLHAAYDRLSASEKERINTLLNKEYEKLKGEAAFKERMAFYDRAEPGQRENELHSIIGTEVGTLPSELETYYKQYFNDRQGVVALHQQYANVFLELQKRSDNLSQELTRIEAAIEAATVRYNSEVTQLNKDIATFNTKASNSGFTSNEQFQAERSGLVARASQLDTRRQTINNDIAKYNQLREELVSIASQSEALNRSVNSSLAPAPSI